MLRQIYSTIINSHGHISRIIIAMAVVGLIVFAFPQKGSMQYEYEVGRPWVYQDVVAGFDFSIKKSEQQIEREKQEAAELVLPHFTLLEQKSTTIEAKTRDLFNARFALLKSNTEPDKLIDSLANITAALSIIESVYSKGVYSNIDGAVQHSDQVLVVMKGQVANTNEASFYYTPEQVLDFAKVRLEALPKTSLDVLMPILNSVVEPNLVYDNEIMDKLIEERVSSVSPTMGVVKSGQTIIRKGDLVTKDSYQKIVSYESATQQKVVGLEQSNIMTLGYFILVVIGFSIFGSYLFLFEKEVFAHIRRWLFVFLFIGAFIVLNSVVFKLELPVLYAIPFCIVPIVLRAFFGAKMALYAHMTVILISAAIIPSGYGFVFVQMMAGIVAIYGNMRARYWSQFFSSCVMVLMTYCMAYLAVLLIREGSFDIDYTGLLWIMVNVFLTLLAYPLIPAFERLFNFVSGITLVELSDLNKPLLKELSMKAPGTFQHSLQVANLSEAAASEIGANSLLVKVGALYHDVGKMNNPQYFTENNSASTSPHDQIDYEESAAIILKHVIDGVDLAKQYGLPEVLIDFIRTHHGTSKVEYFYRKQVQEHGEGSIDPADFQYRGPLPYNKETAILMMADAVEASSKSLKDPSNEDIANLVDKIIAHQIDGQQFINSDLTFKDIDTCKQVFKQLLNSIYHVRVEYPE